MLNPELPVTPRRKPALFLPGNQFGPESMYELSLFVKDRADIQGGIGQQTVSHRYPVISADLSGAQRGRL